MVICQLTQEARSWLSTHFTKHYANLSHDTWQPLQNYSFTHKEDVMHINPANSWKQFQAATISQICINIEYVDLFDNFGGHI